MRELNELEIMEVSGGVDQATAIGSQFAIIGIGVALATAGFALTPLGAALFIGTSIAITYSNVRFSMK